MSEPRLLIVNADDFGLTNGVCNAILRAAREGIVTSTSVLANAPALAAALPALRDADVGLGAHLTAVGHLPPLLSASEIPTLVDRRGQFPHSWHQFLPRMAAHRVDPDDLRREFTAQLAMLRAAGLELTHVDTHQNLHLWPSVAKLVIELTCAHDIHAIRVTRSNGRSPIAVSVRAFSTLLTRRVARAGLATTAASAGFDEAGRLDRERLLTTIARLGASGAASAELACHPSEAGDPDLASLDWEYRWADELAALVNADVRDALDRNGFVLGTFADVTRQPAEKQHR